MKSLPSLPWWKVRHQLIGDRIIKLTNRCVWVIEVSNPPGGPQGKCQLINNTSPWTGSALLQSMSLLLPRGAKPCPKRPLFALKRWKATLLNISATLQSDDAHPPQDREWALSPFPWVKYSWPSRKRKENPFLSGFRPRLHGWKA